MAVTRNLSLLWIIACLLVSVSRESMQMPTTTPVVKTTEQVANTTTVTTTTTTVATTGVDTESTNGVGSIPKNNNYTNYALHDQKLLVNGNLDTSQLPRNIATSSSQTSGGISITLMAVLLVVITLIISIILTAVFVMRRRFSIWRVNGDRLSNSGRDDGAKGALTKSTSSENTSTAEVETKVENEKTATTSQEATLTNNESKKSIECEKKMDDEEAKEVLASCIAELNSVENPQALVCVTEPAKTETSVTASASEVVEQKTEEVKTDIEVQGSIDQQPSPATSETRLIAAEPPSVESVETKSVEQTLTTGKSASTVSLSSSAVNPVSPIPSTNDLNPTEVVATATTGSLITNVISDIADTVASKLASKSASKSALNDNTDEKEPLNNE